ncbi:MAG: glycoside-pentoside-hexuronide (GPH):cation symporter [Sphingomonas bacterium]|nr:glycoside-pentoside-hexuronide (GPH):cation symporter [Sphingomonas bacterium]
MTETTTRLPLAQRLGYGIGDFGFNLFFTTASLYLLFYYTDVLGLPASTAGWVFAVALIWDALFDPVMGYIANRTRTRWGRYRPYLLFGGLPLAASWALMFLPVPFTGGALVMFAVATHILFRTLYGVVGMPYLALSATMTRDSHERGVLASIRMVAATTCGLFAAFSTLKLVAALGGGSTGFFWTATLYGALATIIFLIVFFFSVETATDRAEASPTFGEMLRSLRGNRAFWIVCAAMLASAFGGTLLSKTLPYYFKYALNRPDLIGLGLTALTAAVALSMPVWMFVMKRSSKRMMWLTGAGVALLGYALLWRAADSPTAIMLPLALIGFGVGASYLGFWAMMPDTVEYGQYKTGIRSEGGVFGVVSLIQKTALGLAAAMLGELLSWAGYRANMAQTPDTLLAMKVIMIGGAATLVAIAALVIAFYPIDARLHGRLRRVIARRDAKAVASI